MDDVSSTARVLWVAINFSGRQFFDEFRLILSFSSLELNYQRFLGLRLPRTLTIIHDCFQNITLFTYCHTCKRYWLNVFVDLTPRLWSPNETAPKNSKMLSFQLNAAAGSGEVNSKIKFCWGFNLPREEKFFSRERILPVMRVLSYWS